MRSGPRRSKQISHPLKSHISGFSEHCIPAARVLSVTELHDRKPGSVKLALRTAPPEGVLKKTIFAPVWTKRVSTVSEGAEAASRDPILGWASLVGVV